jgi:hypothetical protein
MMTNALDFLAHARAFTEFAYQLVYLRPSEYSDERIAVGVIAESSFGLEARFVSSVKAIELMSRLVGEEGVEQFHFAAAELRRCMSSVKQLNKLCVPSDLLLTGGRLTAYSSDRAGLLASILSTSCLMREGPDRHVDMVSANSPIDFSKDIFGHVARLDPGLAERIFNQRVTIDAEEVELPICGSRIFGAPVSFALKDQTMRTEAYIAKFRWLRGYLTRQQPRVYVLRPASGSHDHNGDAKLRKLHSIAEASEVALRMSETTEEIAVQILQDEAA